MKNGHWIPISKGFLKTMPHDREYTELEAAYSLQVDYDCKNEVTVAGYSDLWRWSRGKVYRFLKRMNIEIKYPEDTTKKQNQNGQIAVQITDRSRTDNGQIRLIENSYLQEEKNRSRTDNGQITDRSQNTTIDPIILNPKSKKKNNKRKTLLPDNYKLGKKHIDYANSKGITDNLDDVFEGFCINHKKRGTQFVDWYAAWQTWVRNKIKWDKEKEPAKQSKILSKKDIDKLNE